MTIAPPCHVCRASAGQACQGPPPGRRCPFTSRPTTGDTGGEQVWTVPESKVYHRSRDCSALNRRNRYWPPHAVSLADATSDRYSIGRRRPCGRCAKGDR